MQPADRTIDLTAQVCPMTFVRTRLALDGLAPGQTLMILLRGEEPQARVPRTVKELGHTILDTATDGDGVLHLLVRKAQPAASDQSSASRISTASPPPG